MFSHNFSNADFISCNVPFTKWLVTPLASGFTTEERYTWGLSMIFPQPELHGFGFPLFEGSGFSCFLSGNYPSDITQLTGCWDGESQPFLSCFHIKQFYFFPVSILSNNAIKAAFSHFLLYNYKKLLFCWFYCFNSRPISKS